MIKVVAFFGAAVGAVYAEPGAGNIWTGLLLPALFLVCVAFLFWFQGFAVLGLGAASWYFMDLAGGDWFSAGLLPLAFGACLVYFLWWFGFNLCSGFSDWNAQASAGNGSPEAGGGDGGGDA